MTITKLQKRGVFSRKTRRFAPQGERLEAMQLMSTLYIYGSATQSNKVLISNNPSAPGFVVEQWFDGKNYSRLPYGPQYTKVVFNGGAKADYFDAKAAATSWPPTIEAYAQAAMTP